MNETPSTISRQQYQTDLLTNWQRVKLLFGLPLPKALCYLVVAITGLAEPRLLLAGLPIAGFVALFGRTYDFPARYPRDINKLDPSDPKPGGKGYHKARGSVYLGNHRYTGKEAWVSWNDMLTHLYMLAATGGGKSEAIWAIFANFYCAGSAFTLGDGKGTLQMVQDGRVLARRFGVEDNYFVINYMNESADYAHKNMSNTINPFSQGTAGQLKELVASLALSGDHGANQFFADNASVIIERLFPALCELRDKGLLSLDIETIGAQLTIKRMYELTIHEDVSELNRTHVRGYLDMIGFSYETPNKQGEDVSKMHAQYVSHFGKTISSLSIQYRDIYMVAQGDINMKDITANRRTLVFALPSLEKSGDEVKNLGNILLTAQKNAISTDLGDVLEGTREETTLRLSKNYEVPYSLGFDEWSFYAIKDMALLPAQIRGARYSGLYAAQDYAGTERAGEMDAEQIFDNTRIKLFGALEDPSKSWTRIRELIAEIKMVVASNWKYVPGIFGGRYIVDRNRSETTHRAPIELADLQKQVESEFYLFMRGKLSPISFYYTGLDDQARKAAPGNEFRLVRLVSVFPPTAEEMAEIERNERLQEMMFASDQLFEDIGILRSLQSSVRSLPTTDTRGYVQALMEFANHHALTLGISSVIGSQTVTPAQEHELLDMFSPPEDTSTEFEPPATSGSSDASTLEFDLPATPTEEPPPLSQTTNLPEPEPESARREHLPTEDGLLDQTLAAKRDIKTGNSPQQGATIMSERQARLIAGDITKINLLLGVTDAAAEEAAAAAVEKMARHCYYLAPPRPQKLQKDQVSAIQARVDELLS